MDQVDTYGSSCLSRSDTYEPVSRCRVDPIIDPSRLSPRSIRFREVDLLLGRQQLVSAGLVGGELERVGRRVDEVAVDVRRLGRVGAAAVVRQLEPALVDLLIERLDLLVSSEARAPARPPGGGRGRRHLRHPVGDQLVERILCIGSLSRSRPTNADHVLFLPVTRGRFSAQRRHPRVRAFPPYPSRHRTKEVWHGLDIGTAAVRASGPRVPRARQRQEIVWWIVFVGFAYAIAVATRGTAPTPAAIGHRLVVKGFKVTCRSEVEARGRAVAGPSLASVRPLCVEGL